MKIPETPPSFPSLVTEASGRLSELLDKYQPLKAQGKYLHWDKLRHYDPPTGLNHREWWMLTKLGRFDSLNYIKLKDSKGKEFCFSVPDSVLEALHEIDLGSGGMVSIPSPITNPQTRGKYLVSSLMEEAITSSQLEGAATTRQVAKEMIKTGRQPRDTSEQMILNNFLTMKKIREWKDEKMTPHLIFKIHKLVTEKTLEDSTAAGRFRNKNEYRVVGDDFGNTYHNPPKAGELRKRMELMCEFANGNGYDFFIYPVVRAIILHFWLAYDHPFVDGNGRTARALFYWSMLNSGYWMFEFISISSILRKAPAKYGRSFLYTETDDNDLTYFIIAQIEVILRAIRELHAYIDRKNSELKQMEQQVRTLDLFNHRQVDLIRHAMKHPGYRYTIKSHQQSHAVTYQTARTDLLSLMEKNILTQGKIGKQLIFIVPNDLTDRLEKINI